jgi:hypothetical protein
LRSSSKYEGIRNTVLGTAYKTDCVKDVKVGVPEFEPFFIELKEA